LVFIPIAWAARVPVAPTQGFWSSGWDSGPEAHVHVHVLATSCSVAHLHAFLMRLLITFWQPGNRTAAEAKIVLQEVQQCVSNCWAGEKGGKGSGLTSETFQDVHLCLSSTQRKSLLDIEIF